MKYTTIIDIANELGISKSTVSRALRGDDRNVNKQTKEKILDVAARLGYKRNELAVNLRQRSTRTIGIVVPEMVTPFYMNFISHAQKQFKKEGYRVTLAQSNEDAESERVNLQMFEDYRVDGILISACHNKENLEVYSRLLNNGIPLVFFDRTVSQLSVSSVKINDYKRAFFMIEYLIRKGKKQIIHLAGPSYIQNAIDRRKGYEDALKKFHISCNSGYVIEAGVDFSDGEKAIENLVKKGISFDAVFCFTEMLALGAKSCLQKHNFQIPSNVAISCISGTSLCKLVYPTVTSVEQPVKQMAEVASRLIIEKINNPSIPNETVELEAKMIIRESTG